MAHAFDVCARISGGKKQKLSRQARRRAKKKLLKAQVLMAELTVQGFLRDRPLFSLFSPAEESREGEEGELTTPQEQNGHQSEE